MPREDATRVRFHEEAPSYKEGEAVEYRSASAGWIPAKVVRVNGNGTYDLDCKQDVPSDRIRAQERGPSFQAGDHVEYFSGSQGKWIPAKVLLQKTDGRLDLDCKQDVSASTVRWPSISSQLHNFTLGDFVEYYSSSQGSWISARVTALKPNGRIDLDCKADVAADSVRQPLPPPGSERLPNLLEPGESVEYFGAKMQRWISAKVLKRNSNGTYDLDCKQNVQPEKLRKGPSQLSSAATSPVGTGALAAYKEGDRVEYFSGSQCRWIPARVLGVTPSGNFNLDCKSDVPSSKIRPPSKNPGDYEVGEVVEYFGASKGLWISTKVLKVNEDGTYDLACKPRVLSGNMRKTSQKEAAVDVKGPVFNIGDSVEYFGVSQGRWIPAKVLSVTAFGNYNLDVKQDVPVDRMRAAVERLADRPAPGDPGSPSHSRNAAAMRGISGATLSAVAAFAEPMQLLRYRSGLTGGYKLELCKDAVKTLESMGQRSVVAISLCGTSQSGKTYLANHLLDRPQQGQQVLQVGGLWSKARTEGVWLWAGGVDKDERSPLILILDCEGFGGPGSTMDEGHGASRDMQILALCWLLSSALVMNCMGGLNEDLFDELKSASHFGDIVEERGTEAYGKPALLWLLRDFEELPKDDKGRSITADEYLEQIMHGREVSKESARKAGNVRHGLLKFFRHRSCHVVPSPGSRPEGSSYAALSKPFKAAMEQFRSKLFAAALACPKAVNGRPLGCVAFAAVLRQLVASVNDGRILSLHAAWESVQHTFCGSLSDELRAQASTLFQSLAAGRSIEGGAKLPLSEEALFTVVRDRKRALKAEWEERAFGDESVRRTYWKELKTSLAREENMVRTQNARVADQQLMEGVKSWQEWLDKEDDTRIDQICNQLGALLARMPAAPVSRASRIAMQAAARRMSAMRSAVTNALERHTDLQRKAVEWGEKAAQQEGSARSALEAQKAALEEAAARAEKAEEECKALSKEIESQEAQLGTNRENLQDQLEGLEASRLREQDMKAKLRVLNESEASLRKDLEQARADVARIDAERFAAERSATQAASAAQAEQDRLKELLQEAQRKIEETKSEVCRERDAHGNEKLRLHQEHEQRVQDARNKHENERQVLRTKQDRTREEHLRMAEEMRQKLEEERQDHNKTKDDDKGRLLEHSRTTGILEGKIIASSEENKVATAEGRLFFFHQVRQQSQWHQPAELNPILGVWKEARDEQGSHVTFWRNDLLRISLWKDPRETSNIFQAAMDGNLFFLQLYSQVSGDLDCTDHRKCSALHYACAGGSAPSTLFLLQQRAMVDRGDVTSTTPLMLACRYGYAGVLKVLLDAQANPCIADHQGQAPLHQAADLGQLDCLHLLLLCGAQAQQRNYQGETALDIAQRKRHLNCLTLLRRHDQFAEHDRPPMSQGPYDFSESKSATDKAAGLTPWAADETESAPWVSAYQEVAANDLIGFPDRYPRYPEIEADSSSDNSDQYTEATDTPRHYRPEAGLLSTLRRRLFPIQADLGLPNRFRFNKATQQWELPSGEADVYELSRC